MNNSIEKNAIALYQKNLLYFATKHQDLHQKLATLDFAIVNGTYQEKYELQYKNRYFDILDKSSNSFFYNQNSLLHAKKSSDSIDFVKRNGSIFTFYKINISDDWIKVADLSANTRVGATAQIINYVNKYTPDTTEFRFIPKFIFFGIALGIHLKEIMAKVKAKDYLIIEKDLELFRLSMFTTDYNELNQNNTITFSIMDKEEDLLHKFSTFFKSAYLGNNYLKYHLLTDAYLPTIKLFQATVISTEHLSYPFYRLLIRDTETPRLLFKGYNFINLKDNYQNSVFSNFPVLIIAPGPSLEKNIEWLVKNKDKFIIVALMASLKTLLKHNVIPHVITHIDPLDKGYNFVSDGIHEKLKNSCFILSSQTSDLIINLFDKQKMFFFEVGPEYKKGFGLLAAPSVGEVTYALMLIFNVKNLFLLGLDLAIDSETGKTHTNEHMASQQLSLKDKKENITSMLETLFEVKGNFNDTVFTTQMFKISINAFKTITQKYKKPFQQVYNLNDGAQLSDTIPMKTKDIVIDKLTPLNFSKTVFAIEKLLNKSSSNTFRKIDRDVIIQKIEEAKDIKKQINIFEKSTYNNLSDYSNNLNILIFNSTLQIDIPLTDIKRIYTNYFNTIMGYISSFFNTKDLTDINQHIININKILLIQLYKIVDYYITSLEAYLKEEE